MGRSGEVRPESAVLDALRAAARQVRHHPRFALVTMLVLGLGTGAAATVFAVVDAVVLRPLPYAAPDRLVTIWDTNAEKAAAHDPISPVNFMDVRALPVFEDAAAWWRPGINLVDPGLEPARVTTIEVSGNLFALLGVKPQSGAGFPDGGPLFAPRELIAVISDRLWRTRYGADPSVIGRPLLLNDEPYTVVGVMPPGFQYPDDVDVWQRLRWDMTQHSRAAHFMEAVARMKPDVTVAQAQAAADALTGRFQTEFPQTNRGWGTRLVPQLDETLGYYRPALSVLLSAVAVLLAIACINVASLLLTRALSREREVAVRVALGATPRQLLQQMLAEGLILAAGGAVAGLALTAAALPLLQAYTPVSIPRLAEAAVDVRTVAAALAVIVGATMFFALVPALASLKRQLTTELKSGERGSSRGARRLYSVLVGAELALACGLLVGSALLVRTVQRMTETPTGVNAVDAATTRIQVRPAPGPQATIIARWSALATQHAAILDAVRQEPGVQAAGATNFLPFEVGWREPFLIAGDPPPPRREDAPQAQLHSVSDGYFAAMGARIVRGRDFAAFDGPDAPGAVDRQRDVRAPLPGQPRAGGDHVDEPGQWHRPARREPEVGARPARRAGRDRRRRRRHPQRRARPGRRARDLLHHAPVPLLGGGHRRARRGCRHRHSRRPERPAQGRAGSADGRAPHLGQPAGRTHRRRPRAAQRAHRLRRAGGAAGGGRRLRLVLMGGGDAHSRAGDSARAGGHGRYGGRAGRAPRGDAGRDRAGRRARRRAAARRPAVARALRRLGARRRGHGRGVRGVDRRRARCHDSAGGASDAGQSGRWVES